jgi:hypothetical protein
MSMRRLPLLLSALLAFAGHAADPNPLDYGEDDDADWLKYPAAERPARRACTICHLFVEPRMLTRENWATQILPRMMCELGVAQPDYSSTPDAELLKARNVYPDKPRIPVGWWPQIVAFYTNNAPINPLPQEPPPQIGVGLKHFIAEPSRFRNDPPLTTLVKISPKDHRVYAGDDGAKTLSILDADGALLQTLKVGNTPVDLVEFTNRIYVSCIGSFIPTEKYLAEFVYFDRKGDAFSDRQTLLKDLPRSVQAQFADLNGDGKLDFAFCLFGNRTGRFSWFENQGNDRYEEHVLSNKSGAMYCDIRDYNGDGKPDILVLMAQELEMLILFLNDGKGNFASENVWQKPPVWGHSYFEVADFNGDKRPDALVVNGDNGEYESPTKNYHGIRILLNQGNNEFKEAWFYPLNGAYKAIARDFDRDGDLDIAVISFFPDYVNSPRESFVYLENLGDLHFDANTFRECIAGRWLAMDAEDLDGDGDLDIVLGAYCQGPTAVPKFLYDAWNSRGRSVQILRNQIRQPARPLP